MEQILSKNKENNKYARIDKLKEFAPFLGLILIILFFEISTKGKLLSASNFPVFINFAFPLIIASCGASFLMAQGNLDFSMSANVCLTAACAAMASQVNIWLTLPVALLVGSFLGLINGAAHVFLGLPAFIATLSSSYMFEGIAKVVLGSGSIAASYDLKNFDTTAIKYTVLAIILIATFILLERTVFGKQCKAIGAKVEVARQSGVRVNYMKILTFVITGLGCGVVAMFSLLRTCSASPNTGAGLQIDTMLALMLGGIPFSGGWSAKFKCVIIGSLMMVVVSNGLILMAVPSLTQQIIKGILFVVAVAVSFDRKNAVVIK